MARANELRVAISGDATQLNRAMDSASAHTKRFAQETEGVHVRIRKSFSGMALSAAKTGAAFAGAYASIEGVKNAIETTESLAHATLQLHRNTGLSVKSASEWTAVAKTRNIEAKALQQSFGTLSKNIEASHVATSKQAQSFKDLGISQKTLRSGDFQRELGAVADKLGKMEGGTKRTALGMQLFGRGWQTVLPILAKGSKGMNEQLKLAEKYGATFGGNTAKSMEAFIEKQREAQLAMMGLQITIGTKVAPVVTKVIEVVANFVAELRNGTGAGGRFADKMVSVGKTVSDAIRAITPVVKALLPVFEYAFKNIIGIAGGFLKFMRGVFTGNFGKIWSGLTTIVKSYTKPFRDAAGALGHAIWNGIKSPITSMVGWVKNAFHNVLSVVQDAIDFVNGHTGDATKVTGGGAVIGPRIKPTPAPNPTGKHLPSAGRSVPSAPALFGGASSVLSGVAPTATTAFRATAASAGIDVRQFNHTYAASSMSHPGATLSVKAIRAIYENAGFSPGRALQMAQIARGESSYHPGIISFDHGIGLSQITPWAMGASNRAFMNRLGGEAAMRNPVLNAIMAKHMYDAGGFSPWNGTRYLNRSMNVAGIRSVLGHGAIRGSSAPTRQKARGHVTGNGLSGLRILGALQQMSADTGVPIFVQSGKRTMAQQQALVAQKGLYGPGNLTGAAAPSPSAPHVRGVAADITPGRERFGGIAHKYGLAFPLPKEPWHIQEATSRAFGYAENGQQLSGANGGGGGSAAHAARVTPFDKASAVLNTIGLEVSAGVISQATGDRMIASTVGKALQGGFGRVTNSDHRLELMGSRRSANQDLKQIRKTRRDREAKAQSSQIIKFARKGFSDINGEVRIGLISSAQGSANKIRLAQAVLDGRYGALTAEDRSWLKGKISEFRATAQSDAESFTGTGFDDAALTAAQISTPNDTADDLKVQQGRLWIATANYAKAVKKGDRAGMVTWGAILQSAQGAISDLTGGGGGPADTTAADLTTALQDLKASIDAQNNYAAQVTSVSLGQAWKALADVVSGQITGVGYQGRAAMAGSGAVARY